MRMEGLRGRTKEFALRVIRLYSSLPKSTEAQVLGKQVLRKAESGWGVVRMRMEGLRGRTKEFALRVIRLYSSLPKSTEAQVLGKQVLRSGTSVAANFREASRARSDAEFIAKLGIVEQELDESMLWFELLVESHLVPQGPLHAEADELLKIIVTSIKKTRAQSG